MRASDLLRAEVFAAGGEKVGHVFEMLADKSGPVVTELQGPALTVCELFVGPRASLLRLGYKSREMQGPPGVRLVQKRLSGYRVPWDEIESIEPGRIQLRCSKSELADI
jgi:sporulation protein YlmC with PRC-barrel domain